MIIKYNEFIKETNTYESNPLSPEDYGIEDYKWNNGFLDCYQEVDISEKMLEYIPFKFGKIYGRFICNNNELTSLVNSPQYVEGDFYCSRNNLSNLVGCPKYVEGGFYFGNNPVSHNGSIEDYPLCIINHPSGIVNLNITKKLQFPKICELVRTNVELFKPLLNDKIKFHQMVMRLDPTLIPEYITIEPPTKKSILFV